MKARIAVTACPYSGTKYMAVMLNELGLEIGHERTRSDGVSSWIHIHMGKEDFIRDGYIPEMVLLHQFRHPLMVISQLRKIAQHYEIPRTHEYVWNLANQRNGYMDLDWKLADEKDNIKRSMRWWYDWNMKGKEKADESIRVEELSEKWEWFLHLIGLDVQEMPDISRTVNRKNYKEILSWKDLYEADGELAEKILDFSTEIGYYRIPFDYLKDPHYEFPESFE